MAVLGNTCRACGVTYVVASLARDCEQRDGLEADDEPMTRHLIALICRKCHQHFTRRLGADWLDPEACWDCQP